LQSGVVTLDVGAVLLALVRSCAHANTSTSRRCENGIRRRVPAKHSG
jgi:hypothetical protein